MKCRIILYEDNKFVRDMQNFFLIERGYEVFSYKDAGVALWVLVVPIRSASENNESFEQLIAEN